MHRPPGAAVHEPHRAHQVFPNHGEVFSSMTKGAVAAPFEHVRCAVAHRRNVPVRSVHTPKAVTGKGKARHSKQRSSCAMESSMDKMKLGHLRSKTMFGSQYWYSHYTRCAFTPPPTTGSPRCCYTTAPGTWRTRGATRAGCGWGPSARRRGAQACPRFLHRRVESPPRGTLRAGTQEAPTLTCNRSAAFLR